MSSLYVITLSLPPRPEYHRWVRWIPCRHPLDPCIDIVWAAKVLHLSGKRIRHGPLARYVNLRVAHALGMPGTFPLPPWVSDCDMHHGTCMMHVPWCMSGSLTSGLIRSRWRGKRSQHSRRMRNPQFYVSGKRPILYLVSRNIEFCEMIIIPPSPLHKVFVFGVCVRVLLLWAGYIGFTLSVCPSVSCISFVIWE